MRAPVASVTPERGSCCGRGLDETGQAEIADAVEAPTPGAAARVDGQGGIKGHGVGERGDLDARWEVDLDGLRLVRRQPSVPELAIAVDPPAIHSTGRRQSVAVRVRGGDLHDLPRNAGDGCRHVQLELADGAFVADDAPAVDGGARAALYRGRGAAPAGAAAGGEHQTGGRASLRRAPAPRCGAAGGRPLACSR